MNRQHGPTKKLVPTLNPETSCPCEFREEDGLSLEVDCSSCQGANDLSNRTCLSGILNSISTGPRPQTIVLKRFIHKRYRGEYVRFACSLASELSALRMAMASLDPPSDRRCRTCRASGGNVLNAAKRTLLHDPLRYLQDRPGVRSEIFDEFTTVDCPKASACISEGLSISALVS